MELIFEEVEDKAEFSRWTKTVPIIPGKNIITAYLLEEVYSPSAYAELCYTLEHTDAEQVVIVINNDGGELASTLSIVDSMSRCTCEIVGRLSGTVASAGTMLALACDKLEVAPHTSFMIHSASGGTSGKTHETKAYMEFNDKSTREIFNTVYKGFLTEGEIKKVLDGKDMWMGKDEILERFAKMKAVK